ncbi:MAG: ACT domain-containing protein [Pseudomonadota bacterium]
MTERDLSTLLSTLTVTRKPGLWAYSSEVAAPGDDAIFAFKEEEGWTSVVEATIDTSADNRWVWLILDVYSDLHAVGFLAAVAQALAEADVPCNAVAGFHHDHIFVPEAKAKAAVAALRALATSD